MGLFGPGKEERGQAQKLLLDKLTHVTRAKPLGVAFNEGAVLPQMLYAFLLEFEDGHRELYSGPQDDEGIAAIIDKVAM